MARSRTRKSGANRSVTNPITPLSRHWRLLVAGSLLGAAGAGLYLYGHFVPVLAEASWRSIIGLFGAGLPIALAVLCVAAGWLVSGSRWPFPFHWRFGLALLVTTVFLYGVLGMFRPAIDMSGVSLAQVSAGGAIGSLIVGLPDGAGLLRLIGLLLAAYALCWPSRTKTVVSAAATGAIAAGRATPTLAQRLVANRPKRVLAVAAPAPFIPTEDLFEPDPIPVPVAVAKPESVKAAKKEKAAPPPPPVVMPPSTGALPPIELLDVPVAGDGGEIDIPSRVRQIETKLAEYGVDAKVIEVNQGPTITQFGIEPGWEIKTREVRERDAEGRVKFDKNGNPMVRIEELSRVRVKVARILALGNDLALALAVPSVRIEAPVPGKAVVGLEVPNISSTVVGLRKVIESPNFQRIRTKGKLPLALGQDVAGNAVAADLARMPHGLVAGATGAGKSVCINAIVASLLMHSTPEECRMLMIDPKRVEMTGYNDIPHLLAPVVADVPKVVGVLRWVLKEMEDRYKNFEELHVRNIDAWNTKRVRDNEPLLPYLVVIIDELADLMMVASDEVEKIIVRLAQLGRACGIHVIIATQRPSVDVVTGLIKANVPTRIAFAVSSSIDSRTILDQVGAEKLLGRGDMLYSPPDALKPIRVQGVYVSDAEIERIVDWWKALRPAQYIEELVNMPAELLDDSDEDSLMEDARRLSAEHDKLSTSFLQRRLRIGYNRAARLMDALESEGLVEPPDSRRAVAAGIGE